MKRIVDCSFWQRTIDYSVLRTKADGIILRAGQANYRDSKFDEFRTSAESIGFPFGNYWYYDNAIKPKRQAEKWAEVIDSRHGQLGCWLDLEDSGAGEYGEYSDWWDCVAYFKQIVPNAVLGIYTRAEYFNTRAPANHAFRNLPLWIAHYKTNTPAIPKGWTDWLLWQYTDSGDGADHGVGSKEIDMNHYKGEIKGDFTTKLTADFGGVKAEYQEKR